VKRKEGDAEIRVVVEVDGQPIGFMSLDMARLWPLITRKFQGMPADWIDSHRFHTMVRAIVMKNLSSRLQFHLYANIGNEIVRAGLEMEGLTLKAEAAAQVFGRSHAEVEKFAAKTGHTSNQFFDFFWQYMMDERDGIDPKKAWKSASKKR
jgi:hypothetical protein